jgi:hypothetical protein
MCVALGARIPLGLGLAGQETLSSETQALTLRTRQIAIETIVPGLLNSIKTSEPAKNSISAHGRAILLTRFEMSRS